MDCDARRRSGTNHTARLALLVLIGAGCEQQEWMLFPQKPAASPSPSPGPSAQPTPFFGFGPAPAADELAVVRVQFDVLRVDLPIDPIRHSLNIWNHVDEAKGDPGLTALLARNGVRIGVATEDAWPALQAVFEQNEGRSARENLTAEPDLPVLIQLGGLNGGESYFVHHRDGRLTGETFAAGQKFARIDYEISREDPADVVVRVTLETRDSDPVERWVSEQGHVVSVRDYAGVVFDELAASFVLKSGQYLVVGASSKADAGYVLGSWWFSSELSMRKFETILCITPQPVYVK